jgi:capsule biosynthesis phosphatase
MNLNKFNLVSSLEEKHLICDNFYLFPYILLEKFYKTIKKNLTNNFHLVQSDMKSITGEINYILDEKCHVAELSFYKISRHVKYKNMIILIPIGGTGERFKKNGYSRPKALINVLGKPIIHYLIDNIIQWLPDNLDMIYIPYNKEYEEYRFEDSIKNSYPNLNFKFLKLDYNTGGAAETINIALKRLDLQTDPSIICLDSDNFYSTDIIKIWNGENKIISFNDVNNNPIYSYVKMENDKVIDIVEKDKISNYACTGAYGFSSCKELLKYTQKILDLEIKQKGEYYTSNVIKEMIKDNIDFTTSVIDISNWHCLGTPIQVHQFCNNYPKISCIDNNQRIKTLRLCFDFDNTLVTFPKIKDDYTSVLPIQTNIDILKYLKSFGHTIIIYTARRMKTHNGNVGKVICDIGKITFDTLEKFDIPFDEIYFGKPQADVYIDDLALNCYDSIEKYLGFYMNNISPRDFNKLSSNSIETYKKESVNGLVGEIYYYNNIPSDLKDLFPIFLDYDSVNYKWYCVEKINGLTLSNIYLSELLTKDMLHHVMNSIKRLHNKKYKNNHVESNVLPIYDNYSKKLKMRYNNYDYSRFENSNIIYNKILNNLIDYENSNRGNVSVIHGDTVMTNILINNFGKIKFIDMRGEIGSVSSIYGDKLYDWAKLYQSLIGYDKILLNKNISESYENEMIECFEDYFIYLNPESKITDLKEITQSLLFSLIPLHDNDKCYGYYNLISKI